MRNPVDITRPYQLRYMLFRGFLGVLICTVLELIAAQSFFDSPILSKIVGTVFVLIYGGYLYSAARKLAMYDNKTYTKLAPDIKYSVIWGLALAACSMLMLAVYYINWKHFGGEYTMTDADGNQVTEFGFTSFLPIAVNLLCYLFLAPYFGFAVTPYGFPFYAIAIMFVVPVAASVLGYAAGTRNFDIVEKLDEMTFEKDDDD